jgi:hypothetical protein
MKTLLVALLVAATPTVAHAEPEIIGRPHLEQLRDRARTKRQAGHFTLGLSLALLTAGMVSEGIFVAQDKLAGLDDTSCQSSCRPPHIVAQEALAGVAMGLGAVGAIAGGVVLKLGIDEQRRLDLAIAPQASARGGGLSLRGRF